MGVMKNIKFHHRNEGSEQNYLEQDGIKVINQQVLE